LAHTDLETAKAEARKQAMAQRAALNSSERAEAAKAAAEHFFQKVDLTEGQLVAAYWPIRDEIDAKPLLTRLMDSGQPVCLPVVMGRDEPLIFRLWEQDTPLYEAGFGTLVPAESAPVVTPEFMIIPLLGFDKTGTRLGYGRGHYDRTIATMEKKPVLVGYAFSAQELETIPREPHDVPLDYLITETGVRLFY